MEQYILEKATAWLEADIDEATKSDINDLIDDDEQGLIEAFYKDLEFGTGGLRGIMGVGTNRINKYTIGMATQGLCNYLLKQFPTEPISIAVAHDSRNNSDLFARITAEVASANGIKAYLFDALRPTPELSFTVRHLGCKSGVVVTASHNPKEYNGYKVYWTDGGQIVPPHDEGIIAEVQAIKSLNEVKFTAQPSLIEYIGEKIDEAYFQTLADNTFWNSPSDLKIVYTSLHGTGIQSIPKALAKKGFNALSIVEAQATPDGDFPTVESPNPEEAAALKMALEQAENTGAELVLGTDPDTDRVGIAVRNHHGQLTLLNGNQTGSVLVYYLLEQWKESGKINQPCFVAKTVVTTDLIADIASHYKVNCYETLTGFKYIAELIREREGKEVFIGGGEESYGYLIGDAVRDKDAVISSIGICEAAAWAKSNGKSFWQLLLDLYEQFGFYRETLLSITKKGKAGAEEIADMMQGLRTTPPATLGGSAVVKMLDYENQVSKDLSNGSSTALPFPKSNVLQFITADGSKITARPSGTEPKIKFYFAAKGEYSPAKGYEVCEQALLDKIEGFKRDLKLN